MLTGVPIGIRLASRRTSALRIRMQPWLTRPGQQVGPVGAVNADEAPARPVGQRRRTCARAERDRAVERAAEAREAVADVELAGWGWRPRGAEADRDAEHPSAVAQERGGQAPPVHYEPRGHGAVAAERRPWHPAGRAVGQHREPDLHPHVAVRVARPGEHGDEVRRPFGRPRPSRAIAAAPVAGRTRAMTARRTGDQRDSLRPFPSGTGLPTANAGFGRGPERRCRLRSRAGERRSPRAASITASTPAATSARTVARRGRLVSR